MQEAARALGVDVQTLARRQALLLAYHAQCVPPGPPSLPLRTAEHGSTSGSKEAWCGVVAHGGGGMGDRVARRSEAEPCMSEAAEAFKLCQPQIFAQPYDQRTSVHRPPSGAGKRFVWGGGASSCGRRGHDCMEDSHFVYHGLDVFGDGEGRVDLFGVFDGHGGAAAADHAMRTLPFEVAAAMGHAGDDVAGALTTAFRRTELSWCVWAEAVGDDSGCTALVVVVVHDVPLQGASMFNSLGATMYAANCGDCRAVLSREGAAVQVTQDHTASVPAESERVIAAGGSVMPCRDGSLRVGGVIEVTRSLGDRRLKPLGLSPIPEIHSIRSTCMCVCVCRHTHTHVHTRTHTHTFSFGTSWMEV